MDKAETIASRNSGMLTAILLLVQTVLLPMAGWMFVKVDSIQSSANQTQTDIAVFGDRQERQGRDIIDIKNTLKGVETKSDATQAHQQIWKTDQNQYKRLDKLRQGQKLLESRVQRLETEAGQRNNP